MRGDRAGRDNRHNKDADNLKSSLKKGNKSKKNRVIFDESANEFFEADYIIVVRDECGYSDDGDPEDCAGCGSCGERFPPQEVETGALSPPEGYKDMGLFNRDGTLREQAWWEAGDVLLVGERSGTVFTPHHLQLLRRLQRERLLRSSNVCNDCGPRTPHHEPTEDYGYEDEEGSDADSNRELRPVARRTGKHIAAGEERPKINSSQQTTPIDECPSDFCSALQDIPAAPVTSEESDTAEADDRHSLDNSPLQQRRGGILKGGRLWKSSFDTDKEITNQPYEDRSTPIASDEDGSNTPRSVRFMDRSNACQVELDIAGEIEALRNANVDSHKEFSQRMETPLSLTHSAPKTNSAVQQLFNTTRPPPPSIDQPVTSEPLRNWDGGARPRSEEFPVRRVGERNLRCSLLRSEARKKQLPKQETTSLTERIRLLTCDVDDEGDEERHATAPEKPPHAAEKPFGNMEKCNEKAFGSASSSSSSSTLSAVPTRSHLTDLSDMHHDHHKRSDHRRHILSTLAPLTACVGSTAHHEGFYYVPPGERTTASAATGIDFQEEHTPDIVVGTPEGEDGLAAFARATAPRTERIKQRYSQESQPASSDDEHDDYGFQRRPAVRGIAAKQQLSASNDILKQMQNELQPQTPVPASQPAPAHACTRTASNYAWPYYAEANMHNSRPSSRSTNSLNWSKTGEYATSRCGTAVQQHHEACYIHGQNMAAYAHYQQRQSEGHYRNCALYANVGCADSSQELYSSQTSSEQTSPVRAASRCRRPESPPPIRSHHQLLYVPYSSQHYHYQYHTAPQWGNSEYANRVHQYQQHYQQQQVSHCSAPSSAAAAAAVSAPVPAQRSHYAHALQLQTLCPAPAPARYRPVPAPQPGGGKQMICYSEKVAAPMYQPAPGSPSRVSRGAPEGAASGGNAAAATSPMAPPSNPVYYAMNV